VTYLAASRFASSRSMTIEYYFMEEHEIYAMIGHEGFERLVAAFYRQVPNDDVLGPIYPAHDFKGAEQRLRDFLIFRFGGPADYIEERGHPRLRMRRSRSGKRNVTAGCTGT
jgi:truncated hemoglobin YjbI